MLRQCLRRILRRIRRRHCINSRSPTEPQTKDREPRLFNNWTAATRTSPISPSSVTTRLQWISSPVFHMHVSSPARSKMSLLRKLQLVWALYVAVPYKTVTWKEVISNRRLRKYPQQRYFDPNVVVIIRLITIISGTYFIYHRVWILFLLQSSTI